MNLWYLIFLLDECLRLVNLLRRLHINTPSVSWSDEFATIAQNYVNKLVNRLLVLMHYLNGEIIELSVVLIYFIIICNFNTNPKNLNNNPLKVPNMKVITVYFYCYISQLRYYRMFNLFQAWCFTKNHNFKILQVFPV